MTVLGKPVFFALRLLSLTFSCFTLQTFLSVVQELNEGNNYTDKHFTRGIENADMHELKKLCGKWSKQGIALHSERSLCNRPVSYSNGWTGSSMKWRLMQAN